MKEVKRQLNENEYLEYIEKWKHEYKIKIESGKCKKIFLECLPIGKHNGGSIDWKNSIGYKVYFIYNDIIGFILIENYKYEKKSIISLKYNNKNQNQFVGDFTKCKIGNLIEAKRLPRKDFEFEVNTRFKDTKRDLIITAKERKEDKKGRKIKTYKYTCCKCGWTEGQIRENHLKKGVGCACCCTPPKTVVENINSIYHTNPWMIPYIGENCAKTHTHGTSDKIQVVCSDCGNVKKVNISDIYNNHSIGCSCGDGYSYGHKYIFSLLIQLKHQFVDNYTFDWCKFYNPFKQKYTDGEYDFVLENLKLIIEVDGDFHRKDNNMTGQTKEESVFLDNEKDRLANEHGYKVIRISDEGDIKQNILVSDLNRLFDLSDIKWFKCEEFALSNRVKEACELKMNNPEMTTNNIGEVMSLNRSTIIKYLKKGKKIGWCDYDAKEEASKNGVKVGKMNNKITIMFYNETFQGVFSSAKELEKQSERLFGIKLKSVQISAVCKGKNKTHRGYKFKYVQDLTSEEYLKYNIENELKHLGIAEKEIKDKLKELNQAI